MIEAEIRKLDERVSADTLSGLEADIWAGVAARTGARKAGRLIASYQAAFMATAVAGSVIVGAMTAASAANTPRDALAFANRTDLTPSTRLLGLGR